MILTDKTPVTHAAQAFAVFVAEVMVTPLALALDLAIGRDLEALGDSLACFGGSSFGAHKTGMEKGIG